MTRRREPDDGSYQHMDKVVVAFLQGRKDPDATVRAILEHHSRYQIRAVLLDGSLRYRRFNRSRFSKTAKQL
jgi:intein-encoded DNA endonuclease-like protein